VKEHPLDAFFSPRTVAVIGATEAENSAGRAVLRNLIATPFGGAVFPVNPKRSSVLGIKAYPDVASIPDPVDLAVIVTPAPSVPGVVSDCAAAGVAGAVVISAGFKEAGPAGAALEDRIIEAARRGRMRLIGPNCLGVMCPVSGLNATFASAMAHKGAVAFISQSGALCTSILDWSLREMAGFSAFISVGSMLDVGWADLIDYLGDDPHTRAIVIYMESIGDARAFLSAAREVALNKPIIVIKAGRTAEAAQAAASHTGVLTGSDDVLDAAFRRCGVLRVNRVADLFYMAEVLGKQPRSPGNRLSIVTNAGGPGVLATDELIQNGGELASLSPETLTALDAILPPHWSHHNPVDVLGDADAERYAKAAAIVSKDPASDGILAILTPQGMTDPAAVAQRLAAIATPGKPVLASWMGGSGVAEGQRILNLAGIPTFDYPDTAARAFCYMFHYSDNLRGLYETPSAEAGGAAPDPGLALRAIQGAVEARRTLLTEFESKRILNAYGIPTVETLVAAAEDEAVSHAARIGYPAVLKLFSETITHKAEVGGVQLNLRGESDVRRAYREIQAAVLANAGPGHFLGVTVQRMVESKGFELILGSSVDPQFGPVLLFGSGGRLVEVLKDRSLGLPPLNSTLARRMIERTRIFRALADTTALEQLVVRFSRLVLEQPRIREIDINPLLASQDGLLALDARVLLHPSETPDAGLPRPAICPYPAHYSSEWTATDGERFSIRPIRPEDEPAMARFHATLSERSVYFRYFHVMKLSQRTAHERLLRICFIDYAREMALVAECGGRIAGVGRLSRLRGTNDAECAVIVSDSFQGKGLGTELLRRVIEVARAEGVSRVVADILGENRTMQKICERAGFRLHHAPGADVVAAELTLAT
jgi:acetyltransferase